MTKLQNSEIPKLRTRWSIFLFYFYFTYLFIVWLLHKSPKKQRIKFPQPNINTTRTLTDTHFTNIYIYLHFAGHQSKEAGIRTLVALDDQGGESIYLPTPSYFSYIIN